MKILHFFWSLDSGGSENLAVDLANEQAADHEVPFLVVNARFDPSLVARLSPSVRFINIGRPESSRNPYWVVRLLWAIHQIHADAVHSHADNLATLGRFIQAPLVLTVHDTKRTLSRSISRFSVVCCISRSVYVDIQTRYPQLNLRQVDNGIHFSQIAERVAGHPGALRGVQVSRLRHKLKGQDLLIKALSIINANHATPQLTVDFIGDGPSLEYLQSLAKKERASKYCNFLGLQSREYVYQNLCNYDLLIQPSRFEGFGLTVAEGMAAGISVVVSDIEGPMEVIDDGTYGYAFKSDSVNALVDALKFAMASQNTPEEKTRLVAARAHVASKYDLKVTSEKYVHIYKEVAGV